MNIELSRDQSFSRIRAYTLTQEAFEDLNWFGLDGEDERAQALEQAVVDITGQFKQLDRQIGKNRTWAALKERLNRLSNQPLSAFNQEWADGSLDRRNERNHPFSLVYAAMRDGLYNIATTRAIIINGESLNKKSVARTIKYQIKRPRGSKIGAYST